MAVPIEMLLHPELLTNEQLIHIIQERQLRISNLDRMPRDDLLELFHHYCVPYGQRKYRDSGRGKILNKTRHVSPEASKNLNIVKNNAGSIKVTHFNNDRLKPPPDLLSGHMKRIKIETTMTPTKPIYKENNIKRKMSIDVVPETDIPPPKKEKKLITWP